MSNNMTTVTYINAMGGCKSKECNRVTKRIWLWAINLHNWLSAAYKPRQLNVTADKLSRHFEVGTEWQFNPKLFDRLCSSFGNPQIDLFASRINHQIPVFSINQAKFTNSYAFPPFCLVGRCLQKIVLEQATVIMIVPCWPTQTWFTQLLSLLIEQQM